MNAPYLRSQVGADAHRWSTFGAHRPLVLAIARTFTSTVKLLEALEIFRGDHHRLRVVFTFDDTSAFNAGTEALLRDREICLLPWEEAVRLSPALVLTASENVDLGPFPGVPIVVLPHGIGFQKYVPDSESNQDRISGVVRPAFAEWDTVHTVVSHPAQREQLRAAGYPRLADRAKVIGDPAYDQLRAAARLRWHYRWKLGLQPHQRMVLFSSTWAEESLIGQWPTLPRNLVTELPFDGYRVASVVHPNVWYGESPWSVREELARAQDAGLIVVPPARGWGSALLAADLVIGDHGSVTQYGACADRPILLGTFGGESVPGTAVETLARKAPRLDPHRSLPEQVEGTIAAYRSGEYTDLAESTFDHVGEAQRRLSALLYTLLGLAEPDDGPHVRALPIAEPEHTAVRSFEVRPRFVGPDTVHVERFPAAVRRSAGRDGRLRHLASEETEKFVNIARSASVIYLASPSDAPSTAEWLDGVLDRNPGCLMAAAPVADGCHITRLHGPDIHVTADDDPPDPCLAAALVYALERDRRAMTGDHTLQAGGREWHCTVRLAG